MTTDLTARIAAGEGDNAEVLRDLADRASYHPKNGDRALIREIMCSVGGWYRRTPSECGRKHGGYIHPDDVRNGKPVYDSMHGTDIHRDVPDILHSIDAAMEFAARLLGKGWVVALAGYRAVAVEDLPGAAPGDINFGNAASFARTPAMAVVCAALRQAAILRTKETTNV